MIEAGFKPTYIAESDQVFFYDASGDQEEYALFVAARAALETPRRVIGAPRLRV